MKTLYTFRFHEFYCKFRKANRAFVFFVPYIIYIIKKFPKILKALLIYLTCLRYNQFTFAVLLFFLQLAVRSSQRLRLSSLLYSLILCFSHKKICFKLKYTKLLFLYQNRKNLSIKSNLLKNQFPSKVKHFLFRNQCLKHQLFHLLKKKRIKFNVKRIYLNKNQNNNTNLFCLFLFLLKAISLFFLQLNIINITIFSKINHVFYLI